MTRLRRLLLFAYARDPLLKRTDRLLFGIGAALLIVFLLTGQYLQHVVKPGLGEDTAHRMMARASHLYIFFISLLIMLSSFIEADPRSPRIGRCIYAGKALLVAASICLEESFFRGHAGTIHDRGWVLPGCVLALAGGLLISVRVLAGGRQSDAN